MTTRAFREYAINTGERYFPFPHRIYPDRVEKQRKWTATIHEPTCRFAKITGGHPEQGYYRTEDGLRLLAERGFACSAPATSQYADVIWQGCKVCGTALQEQAFKDLAAATLAEQEQAKQRSREYAAAEQAKFDAKQERARAIELAQRAHYAEHFKDAVDTAMRTVAEEVGAQWDAENPEKVALFRVEDKEV